MLSDPVKYSNVKLQGEIHLDLIVKRGTDDYILGCTNFELNNGFTEVDYSNKPLTHEEFIAIKGLGEVKCNKFCNRFIFCIKEHSTK